MNSRGRLVALNDAAYGTPALQPRHLEADFGAGAGTADENASAAPAEAIDRHAEHLDAPEQAVALFGTTEPFYCVMPGQFFDEFTALGLPIEAVYERDGMWVTSGRALWRRALPPTRFVVARGRQKPALPVASQAR